MTKREWKDAISDWRHRRDRRVNRLRREGTWRRRQRIARQRVDDARRAQ